MSEYIYLFSSYDPTGSPEELQQRMEKWMTWSQDLRDKGHLQSGRPLEHTGKRVSGRQKTVTDGPFAETKDLIGGFMLIEANDIDHAVELSLRCPILEGGGMVEVRPVMEMVGT